MRPVAQFSLFGAWRPCAPACSCVVSHIRACFYVFSLILTSASASFGILDVIPHFRIYYPCHPEIGNLPHSLALFLKAS